MSEVQNETSQTENQEIEEDSVRLHVRWPDDPQQIQEIIKFFQDTTQDLFKAFVVSENCFRAAINVMSHILNDLDAKLKEMNPDGGSSEVVSNEGV